MFIFIRRILATFYLITKPAVPFRLKLLPLAAFVYLMLPRDLLPDYVRGLGLIDDVVITTVVFGIFTTKALKHIAADERRRKNSIDVDFEVLGRVNSHEDPDMTPVDDRPPTDDIRNS